MELRRATSVTVLFVIFMYNVRLSFSYMTMPSQQDNAIKCAGFTNLQIQIDYVYIKEDLTMILQDVGSSIMMDEMTVDLSNASEKEVISKSFYCFFQGIIKETNAIVFANIINNVFSATFSHDNMHHQVNESLGHQNTLKQPLIVVGKKNKNATVHDSGYRNMQIDQHTIGHGYDKHNIQKRSLKINHLNHPLHEQRFIRMVLVGDKAFITKTGGESTAVLRLIEMNNIINAVYRQLGITVILAHVIVWNFDRFDVSKDTLEKLHEDFIKFNVNELKTIGHDVAYFVTGTNVKNDTIGRTEPDGLCLDYYSVGLAYWNLNNNTQAALTIAQTLGYNLGFQSDYERPNCTCPEKLCIMNLNDQPDSFIPYRWSSCTKEDLKKLELFNGPGYCTRSIPKTKHSYAICGNGIVETGEQCDLGIALNPAKINKCCNISTCQFTSIAKCASGECCNTTTCSPYVAGHICRPEATDCDLTEVCNGASEWCPPDDYKSDGISCAEGQAFCYGGEYCGPRKDRCKMLFGNATAEAACEDRNKLGTEKGFCSATAVYDDSLYSTYKACSDENKRCGLLHCSASSPQLKWLGGNQTWVKSQSMTVDGKNVYCTSASIMVGMTGLRNPGMVPNGAECGHDKMCVNSACQNTSPYLQNCPNCNGNGVCTKDRLCFCKPGFDPPACTPNLVSCGGSTANRLLFCSISRDVTPIEMYFTFIGDYNKHVNPDKSAFVNRLLVHTSTFLNVATTQITHVQVSSESPTGIKVKFVLVPGSGLSPVLAMIKLKSGILNSTYSMAAADGTNLYALGASLVAEVYHAPCTTHKENKLFWIWIIIAIVVAVLLILLLIIICVLCCLHRRENRLKVHKNSQTKISIAAGKTNHAFENDYHLHSQPRGLMTTRFEDDYRLQTQPRGAMTGRFDNDYHLQTQPRGLTTTRFDNDYHLQTEPSGEMNGRFGNNLQAQPRGLTTARFDNDYRIDNDNDYHLLAQPIGLTTTRCDNDYHLQTQPRGVITGQLDNDYHLQTQPRGVMTSRLDNDNDYHLVAQPRGLITSRSDNDYNLQTQPRGVMTGRFDNDYHLQRQPSGLITSRSDNDYNLQTQPRGVITGRFDNDYRFDNENNYHLLAQPRAVITGRRDNDYHSQAQPSGVMTAQFYDSNNGISDNNGIDTHNQVYLMTSVKDLGQHGCGDRTNIVTVIPK